VQACPDLPIQFSSMFWAGFTYKLHTSQPGFRHLLTIDGSQSGFLNLSDLLILTNKNPPAIII